ncbi:MAG: hypothetical protein GF387_01770, partial [Candidatus Portnoybacteria bacterium]|nr:hypothetical protein [Candidatus Portnoybacteria bacterium]
MMIEQIKKPFSYISKYSKKILGYFKEKRTLLDEVKQEKNLNTEIERILKKKTKSLWFSPGELVIVIISFLFFLFITHIQTIFPCESFINFIEGIYPFKGSPFALTDGNHYQNLIAVHAGIGAVLIGLAFFIAQQIAKERDGGNSYKGFAFLKRSKFFPILVAEILFFFLFLWGSVNILSIFPIILIGFFTLLSLYKTIDLMVNDFDLRKEEEKIFAEKLRVYFLKILDSDITKLLGDNLLQKRLQQFGNFVEFTPFSPLNKDEYVEIKTQQPGHLKNIKYGKLKSFLAYLQKQAPKESTTLELDTGIENTQKDSYKKSPYCYITPRFNSSTKEVGGVLCWVRKDLVENEKILKETTKKAYKAFVIGEPKLDLEEARNYILKLKKLVLDSVETQKIDQLGYALNIYTDLIEYFYAYLKPFGGGFSDEQARNMSMELAFGGLKPVRWIADDIREIFERGFLSDSKEIIREVAYLPIRFLKYAIDYEDHLIFQQFQYYPVRLYQHAIKLKKSGNDELAEFVVDRSWRYIKEITDYHLEPKLKEEYPEESFKDFSIAIIKIFQNLLKTSFDNRDATNFNSYLTTVTGLFRNMSISTRYDNEKAETLSNYIESKRSEMLFGLASWIAFQFENNKDDEKLSRIYGYIANRLPSTLNEFTNIFLDCHKLETEKFWGWDNWEMDMKGEGQVHFQILEKLERFYAIRTLTLLEKKSTEEIQKINLPTNRDFAFLAEGTRDLKKTLEIIKQNPSEWSFVLSEQAISKVDDFQSLLEKVKAVQDEKDTQRKREAIISQEKVRKFKKGIVKNFTNNPTIRNILKHYNHFVEKLTEIPDKVKKIGINTVFDKAPFFDESVRWHVSYLGFEEGFDFGRSMANGENRE